MVRLEGSDVSGVYRIRTQLAFSLSKLELLLPRTSGLAFVLLPERYEFSLHDARDVTFADELIPTSALLKDKRGLTIIEYGDHITFCN